MLDALDPQSTQHTALHLLTWVEQDEVFFELQALSPLSAAINDAYGSGALGHDDSGDTSDSDGKPGSGGGGSGGLADGSYGGDLSQPRSLQVRSLIAAACLWCRNA